MSTTTHPAIACDRCASTEAVILTDLMEFVCEACLMAVPEFLDLSAEHWTIPTGVQS